MAHRRITGGEGLPPASGLPFSSAVVSSGFCFISGQVATDPATGKFSSGSIAEETKAAMRNLFAVARAVGFAPEDFLFVTVLLTDIQEFPEFNDVYKQYWPHAAFPARMAYQVGALPFGARVEIQGVAAKQDDADSLETGVKRAASIPSH